jgi:DNA-dependent RNA polymerase auxiliary subunit epsilon
MKVFRIDLDVSSQTYDTCSVYVEAETEDEARAIFNADPYLEEWDDWQTIDSEMQDWSIDKIEYDEWMTNRMPENTDA